MIWDSVALEFIQESTQAKKGVINVWGQDHISTLATEFHWTTVYRRVEYTFCVLNNKQASNIVGELFSFPDPVLP
jgi:hypothetical protein